MSNRRAEDGPVLLALARSVVVYGTAVAANAGRRVAMTVAGYLCAAGLFATSLGFLTLSGYRAMSHVLADVYASLIVGCAYLVVGLVTLLVVQFRRR